MSRKKKNTEKIIPLQFAQSNPDDLLMDEFLKEDLMREADELEAQLENDPKLKNIRAADDLFQKIQAELKEKGVWEEEEPAPDLEELYAMLPEEDRQALELGRRLAREQEQQQAQKQKRRRTRSRIVKRMAGAAAMVVVVFGISMSSDANRRLVSETWNTIVANFGIRMATNYVDEEKVIRPRDKQEIEDFHTASMELDIPEVDLGYLPEGMKYLNCQIDTAAGRGIFFYTYQEKLFQFTMIKKDLEGVYYYSLDNEAVINHIYTVNQEIEVKLGKNIDSGDSGLTVYTAQVEYQEGNYILNGVISLEEMEEIVKNIYFF